MTHREVRQAARVSLEKAAVRADVSSNTARLFEVAPTEVKDPFKRAALERVYTQLADEVQKRGASAA
ncbi:MAG: hypothetical protein IT373_11915 [Polyangiaceae bacterium]|nr:hypothetical protein [Polyangiaceae bacterium]